MSTQVYVNNTTLSDAAEANKFDTVAYSVLSGVAGTNTITATGPANYTYAATTPPVWFIPANTNTGATTINITPSGGAAGGAKNIFLNGSALTGGELIAGLVYGLIYDGTQFSLIGPYVSGKVTAHAAAYQWTAWDPSDVAGSDTNAPATAAATSTAVDYVTMANSSGTVTFTVVKPGKYLFNVFGHNEGANAQTGLLRVQITVAGTATLYAVSPINLVASVSVTVSNQSGSASFMVSATAGQTVTILPKVRVTSGGATTDFTTNCTAIAAYMGT